MEFDAFETEGAEAVSDKSSISIVCSNMDLQPSGPPQPYITSKTSTTPTIVPFSSQTGSVRNLLSCISWSASNPFISGVTVSGLPVITSCTSVRSISSSLATTRVIMSLNPKMPISSSLSTIRAAFRCSAMRYPASRTVVVGSTSVVALPASMLRSVGMDEVPNALAIRLPRRALRAAFCSSPPCCFNTCLTTSSAVLEPLLCTLSIFSMASLRHFAISSNPTTEPCPSSTGRCLK
mmetsp:Transcript_173/g.464  ORF Transcript_173/g.464 Transcript_173/m.464 type:complete len:236 (+) Transcript_173:1897-2604(+)